MSHQGYINQENCHLSNLGHIFSTAVAIMQTSGCYGLSIFNTNQTFISCHSLYSES